MLAEETEAWEDRPRQDMVDLLALQDVFSGPLRALASHAASFSDIPHCSHGESPDSWAPMGSSGEGRGVVLLTEGV